MTIALGTEPDRVTDVGIVIDGGDLDVPSISVGRLFDEATDRWRARVALTFYGRDISFGQLRDRVDRLAAAFTDIGIEEGDRVALLLLNSPEFIYVFYAIAKIGAIATPISPVYVSSEIRHQILDSGAEHLICHDFLWEGVRRAEVELRQVVLVGIEDSLPTWRGLLLRASGRRILRSAYRGDRSKADGGGSRATFHRLKDLIAGHRPNPPKRDFDPAEQVLLLPYTGGTTGSPKGVMITHANTVANLHQFRAGLPELQDGRETFVSYMPYYHAAGHSYSVITGILLGYHQIVLTTPDLDEILAGISRYGATLFFGAPTIYELLKDYEKSDRIAWRDLKFALCGADSLHEHTAREWQRRRGLTITEGYGMTEATATTHMNPIGRQKFGSVGRPLPGIRSTVLDPDVDRLAAPGELGEIAVAGPQINAGYWRQPEATKACEAVIDGVRWWRSGDIGRIDEEGYFHFWERKRDLIKYKGLRVFAREVEEVLKTHPKIKEVGVVGEADPLVGENVKAVIVLESDARSRISEEDIVTFCKGRLAHYKIPKIVEFVGEIPKTDIGKVSRREIREAN